MTAAELRALIKKAVESGSSIVAYNKDGKMIGGYGAAMDEEWLFSVLVEKLENPTITLSLLSGTPADLLQSAMKPGGN